MLVLLAVIAIIATYFIMTKMHRSSLRGKRVLVVGGTSGIGREFARQLYQQGCAVTLTSRDADTARSVASQIEDNNVQTKIECIAMDILEDGPQTETQYDYIFCVPGFSVSRYFKDQNIKDFRAQMDLNYLAVVNTLYGFRECNKRPFTFVVIGSTAALFYFPGYSSYSPTKSALLAFAKSVHPELRREGIDLRVYLCPAMQTRGLEEENRLKPEFTKEIEFSNSVLSPEDAARHYLANMHGRRIMAMDWFTYFVMVREDCENAIDYLLFPVAVIVVFVSKLYVRWKFDRAKFD